VNNYISILSKENEYETYNKIQYNTEFSWADICLLDILYRNPNIYNGAEHNSYSKLNLSLSEPPGPHGETNVNMKMAVFWVVAPCSLVEVYRRFRGACCVSHQGDRPDDGDSKHLWNVKFYQRFTRLHGAKSQKTAIFLLAAARASHLKR
jgi:hypothetical protein